MTQAIYFIIDTLTQLVLLLFLLRFWLPLLRADFRNPIAQGILRFTSPLVLPVRRVVPPIGRVDTATVLVTFVIQYLVLVMLFVIAGIRPGAGALTLMSLLKLSTLSLNLFFFAILIRIILSWVAPHTYNPISAMAGSLADPVLRPFRRFIPPIGGLDVSPIFAIVILKAAEILLQSMRPVTF